MKALELEIRYARTDLRPDLELVHWSEKMRRTNELTLLPKSPLLITESAGEFNALRDAFEREIKPRGIIEHMYVDDIACIVWEILRLRRGKAAILNAAFRQALVQILTECLTKHGKFQMPLSLRAEAETLARAWFKDEQGKRQVAETLSQKGFDQYDIEGDAIRRSCSALEVLDRMLASLEARRNRALRCIGEYRYGLGRQLRESSDRVIEEEKVPELEHASSEGPIEPVSSEEPVEPASSEQPVEPAPSEQPVEPVSSEKPVETASSQKPAEPPSSEKPIEPAASGQTVEPASSEQLAAA